MATNASAAPPEVRETWVKGVSADFAELFARLDGGGLASKYRFEYISTPAYQGNLQGGHDGFQGAARVPEPEVNPGKGDNEVGQSIADLQPDTAYHYRAVIRNEDGTVVGPERIFRTKALGGPQAQGTRGWEMVSPIDKNGGEIPSSGTNSNGGVFQASVQGGAFAFSSTSSLGVGGGGAPASSQYIARRGDGGWVTENITASLSAAGSGDKADEAFFQLFSPEMSLGLLSAPSVSPLPGTDAPAGYRNYYLRDSSGDFSAFLRQADVTGLVVPPRRFELSFVGASSDLGHAVFSTCAALTDDAIEVPGTGEGCDPAAPNLYVRSSLGWRLVNVGAPPAQLAAFPGGISSDGSRIFWTDGTNLYLRDGNATVQVDGSGGGGTFQGASDDGSVAFFTRTGFLYRYDVATAATASLTPAGGVNGVLGVSADGSSVYFLTNAGLFLARGGSSIPIAASADPSNFPPNVSTARVSPNGDQLAFVSSAELTPYDNTQTGTGPVTEVYLYDAPRAKLFCVSCNPTGERPDGPSTLPGTLTSGQGKGTLGAYRPRALSADGNRLFFDSRDKLISGDSNSNWDVYEWVAPGSGTCERPEGCVQLVSSGRGTGGARFIDASADGSDAFLLTDDSLVPADPIGTVDLYDARIGGGFPQPPKPIPCEEDACQPLPSPPIDPSLGTLTPTAGNTPVHFPKAKPKKGKAKKKGHRKKHPRRRGSRR